VAVTILTTGGGTAVRSCGLIRYLACGLAIRDRGTRDLDGCGLSRGNAAAAPTVAQRFASSNAAHDLDEQRAQWLRVAQATQALLRARPGVDESLH
jgi:hypothetical protein